MKLLLSLKDSCTVARHSLGVPTVQDTHGVRSVSEVVSKWHLSWPVV